jgi:hypothetical protein
MVSRATVLALLGSVFLGCGSAPPAQVAIHRPPATTDACDAFFGSASVTRLVGYLARLPEIKMPLWTTYRAERHPVVLLGPAHPAAPRCALVQAGGREVARAALDESVTVQAGIFGFYAAAAPGPRALPEMVGLGAVMRAAPAGLRALLARHALDRAMLQRVDFDPALLTALGVDPLRYVDTREVLSFLWIVHETFHLHAQFPTWLDQPTAYAWPAWDRQPDRAATVKTCYGGADGRQVGAERSALRAAFEALHLRGDRSAGCAAARSFVALRENRYQANAASRVASGAGAVSCEVAEAVMELEEGVPDYVARGTALALGLLSAERMLYAYDHPMTPLFYGFGGFELLVIRRLLGAAAMPALTERIAASTDHRGGVFGTLTRTVLDPAICGPSS